MKKSKKIAIALLIIGIVFIVITSFILIKNKKDDPKEKIQEEINIKTEEVLQMENEYIGYLKIDKIDLYAPILDGTDDKVLKKAVGHFKETSYLMSNVCFAAHNRGYEYSYFENLKDLQEGDIVTYITKANERDYAVTEIREVEETDLSILEPTVENQITMITCIENQRNKRLCVIAKEI